MISQMIGLILEQCVNFLPASCIVTYGKSCAWVVTQRHGKRSMRKGNNRKKVDNDDVISRHTRGSRGYDEHRIILERALGRPPTFRELFLATHLTKESKKIFWDGLYDESLDGAEFCTARSRKAYEAYEISMVEKYGEDFTLHPVGDADLWERAQGRRRFGLGSSDPNFICAGTPSSSSAPVSYADYQRSQEQVLLNIILYYIISITFHKFGE